MTTITTLKDIMENQKEYKFTTDKFDYANVSVKGKKEKNAYVTGYISVPEVDIYNDLVTINGLKSMLRQIESSTVTIDFEHEAWRDDNSILPVAKIVEAKVDDRGLWVKAMLNKSSPKYNALWGSIKDGFVNAFSIAFKPLLTVTKDMNGVEVNLIEDLKLLNVAFTGAPVNEGAIMTSFSMKSVMLKAINEHSEEQVVVSKSLLTKLMEEKSMSNENSDAPIAPVVEPTPEPIVEPTPEPVVEPTPEPVVEEKAIQNEKIIAELKSMVEKQAEDNKKLQAEMKSIKEKAVFKSLTPASPIAQAAPEKEMSILGRI